MLALSAPAVASNTCTPPCAKSLAFSNAACAWSTDWRAKSLASCGISADIWTVFGAAFLVTAIAISCHFAAGHHRPPQPALEHAYRMQFCASQHFFLQRTMHALLKTRAPFWTERIICVYLEPKCGFRDGGGSFRTAVSGE